MVTIKLTNRNENLFMIVSLFLIEFEHEKDQASTSITFRESLVFIFYMSRIFSLLVLTVSRIILYMYIQTVTMVVPFIINR